MSGSGKSTLSLELKKKLQDKGYSVQIIDGDAIRNNYTTQLARIFHPVRKKRVWLRTTSFQEHWCMLGRQLCIIFLFQTQLPLTPLFISVPGTALPGFIRALIV
jgi:GTPase SAR1 family protein